MNISLSTQRLNSSSADAIEFLMKTWNKNFKGANTIIEYIRVIDRIFEFLNSRNWSNRIVPYKFETLQYPYFKITV